MRPLNLTIRRGETVALPIRVESDTLTYKTITAIAQSGAARITATDHGCPDGWRAAVMNAKGMTELNAEHNPPKESEMHRVTVIDPNTVEFNAVNAAGFRGYTSGGQLVFFAPLDLSSFTSARMDIKDRVGGTVLMSLNTTDGTLEIDTTNKVVWVRVDATDSAAIAFDAGVFDIELITASGEVTAICSATSTITVLPEVTTTE